MAFSKKSSLIASVAASAAAALAYSVLIEPYLLETVKLELNCPRLPRDFDGYRILQLSDFHTRKIGRRETLLQKKVAALPAHDLVLITGDLIHTPTGTAPFLEIGKELKANDGIFAVFGNSEHKNGVRSLELARRLEEIGIHSLINSNSEISRNNSAIALVGVDDPVSRKEDLRKALTGVSSEQFKVLMMHSPDPIGQATALGFDVVLSGHTHGGQISIPFLGPLHTSSLHGTAMSSGLYKGVDLYKIIGFRPGYTQLYVSRGIGVSGLAMRFLARPEITSITLRAVRPQ